MGFVDGIYVPDKTKTEAVLKGEDGGVPQRLWVPGKWHYPSDLSAIAIGATLAISTQYFVPIWVDQPIRVDAVGTGKRAGTATATVQFGVYAASANKPGARKGASADVTVPAALGPIFGTFTPVDLSPGLYFLAIGVTENGFDVWGYTAAAATALPNDNLPGDTAAPPVGCWSAAVSPGNVLTATAPAVARHASSLLLALRVAA